MSDSVYLKAVFVGIQGEGTLCLGRKQIFLRTCGCNLRCWYCDTDSTAGESFRVHWRPGGGVCELVPNPVSLDRVVNIVNSLASPDIHSVSLTGGEPLLLPTSTFRRLAEALGRSGLRVYLESNGTLPQKLSDVIDCVDFLSMDIKLPSADGREWWDEHEQFLMVAGGIPTCVKVVVCASAVQEVVQAAELVGRVDSDVDFVLQPESKALKYTAAQPIDEWLWPLVENVSQFVQNVYVIPQTHEFLKLK